jgi:hypothetical protein
VGLLEIIRKFGGSMKISCIYDWSVVFMVGPLIIVVFLVGPKFFVVFLVGQRA